MTTGIAVRGIETGTTFLTYVECPRDGTSHRGLGPDLRSTGRPGSPRPLYFSTADEEHGTEVGPSAFAALAGDVVSEHLAGQPAVAGWRAAAGEVLVQDFGVGTARIVWVPDATGPADPGDVVTTPDDLDALAGATLRLLAPLVERATHALRDAFPGAPDGDGVVGLLRSVERELPAGGTPLWVWTHVHAMATDHEQHGRRLAAVFCPNAAEFLMHRDHTYAAATSVCVTVSRPGRVGDGVALSRVLPRQDAWWALLWALDRALLALQMTVDGSMSDGSIRVLVKRARQIERVTARVHLLRSRVDSVLVNAGAREFAAWRTLGKAWDLDLRMDVVQRKLLFLQSAYQSVLSETSRRRADQVSLMVYLFTAVSVIASAVAIVQYAQGPQASAPTARLAVIITCVVAAVAAVLSTLRAQRIRRERTPEPAVRTPLGWLGRRGADGAAG